MELEKKRRVHVLISEKDLVEFLSVIIREVTLERCELNVSVTTYAEELLDLAKRYSFELFVLFLNNILFAGQNLPPEHRLRQVLSLVIHLKARYWTPIIGFYGGVDHASYRRQAMLAGADFVFQAPCERRPFSKAVEACLKESLKTRILLVGDEKVLLDVLEKSIEKYGDSFSVHVTEDGLRAKRLLRKKGFSVVATNLNMPGISGFELLAYIKKHHPGLPVIIMTGRQSAETEKRAMAMGASAYMRKPFLVDDLVNTIHRLL
jgi:CheY-like chemotaxis protein